MTLPSTGAVLIEGLQRQSLHLSHAYHGGLGIEHCASLMFDVIHQCRALSEETFDSLSATEVWKLDTVCQDAIQMTGNAAQWALAPRRDPSQEQDLASLRPEPGVAMKLKHDFFGDPLAMRLSVVRRDICELWSMDSTSPEFPDLASEVLRICTGRATIARFSNAQLLWLDSVKLPPGLNDTALRHTLFDCLLLTLICITRWYASWFNSMIPATWKRRAVRLWAQDIPDIGGAMKSYSHQSHTRCSNIPLSRKQEMLRRSLQEEVRELLAIPFMAPRDQEHGGKNPSERGESRWAKRARKVIAVVDAAIQGRRLQRDPLDEHFSFQLFDAAQKALDNIFIAARIHFGIRASLETFSVFVPAPRGPEPAYDDHRGRRSWMILKTLDWLHETDAMLKIRQKMALHILQQVEGENLIVRMNDSVEGEALPAVEEKDEAWRTEMLRLAEFAIVALAQHVSARFGGREVRLVNQVVEVGKRAFETDVDDYRARVGTSEYPETVSYSDGAWMRA